MMDRAMATRCCSPPERERGKVLSAIGEPHQSQHAFHAVLHLGGRHLAYLQRQGDVVENRQIGQQLEILENEPDLASVLEYLALGQHRDFLVIDDD